MALTDTPDIIVNGAVIPASAINAEVQYHPAETRREALIKAAETLILGELLAQKAVERGITNKKHIKIIDDEPEIFDALLHTEVTIPRATEEECLRYFKSNGSKFKTAPLIEASHILLPSEPKDLEHRAETLNIAESLIKAIQSGETTFIESVKKYSACPSKEVNGSLGQLSYGQTVSEFERQVFAAKIGLMEIPIESRFGFHIVVIHKKIDGNPLQFDYVKEKIKIYLNDKVKRKAIAQYLCSLIKEADIEGYQFDTDTSPLIQ